MVPADPEGGGMLPTDAPFLRVSTLNPDFPA